MEYYSGQIISLSEKTCQIQTYVATRATTEIQGLAEHDLPYSMQHVQLLRLLMHSLYVSASFLTSSPSSAHFFAKPTSPLSSLTESLSVTIKVAQKCLLYLLSVCGHTHS